MLRWDNPTWPYGAESGVPTVFGGRECRSARGRQHEARSRRGTGDKVEGAIMGGGKGTKHNMFDLCT